MPKRKIREKKVYLLPAIQDYLLYGDFSWDGERSEGNLEAFLIELYDEKVKRLWMENKEYLLSMWPHADILPYGEYLNKNFPEKTFRYDEVKFDARRLYKRSLKELYENNIK